MNYRMLFYLFSVILMAEAAFMLLPLLVALIYSENIFPFLITVGILIIISASGVILKPKDTRIYTKDGFVCVAAAWVLMSVFGALPFVIDGSIPSFIDAFFETVSGFTTTGSTILTEIESLPKSILFWRSFTHWIGGMGVLVFILAIIPSDDGRAIHLLRAEVPGPQKGKLVPKLRRTARILYGIYFGFTVIEVIALCIAGLPFYDALVNTFGTVGTGGFSVLNKSIEGYNNPAVEWIMAIFMLICGINFNLYYFLLIKRFRDVFRSEELKTYLAICFVSVSIIVLNTLRIVGNLGECVRDAFFQVASITSTSGFSTTNFDAWPQMSRTVILILMVFGACAGSTAGGLKISRIIIVIKSSFREIKHMLRPRSVNVVKLDGEVVPEETVRGAVNYIALYLVIFVMSFLLVTVDGFSTETNFSAVIACLNNVGPGLSDVGPAGNFAGFSIFSKMILSLDMLFGRLEIMPMIILFSPSTWKRH